MVFFVSSAKAENCNSITGHIIGSDGKDTAAICSYIPLETNPLIDPSSPALTTDNPIADLLGNVFRFGIAAAVALALIMIIWGGIEYMTSDAWFNKQDGIQKIKDALIGLGIALISYTILFIINPCLVDFNITASKTSACKSNNTFLGVGSLPHVVTWPAAAEVEKSRVTTAAATGPTVTNPKTDFTKPIPTETYSAPNATPPTVRLDGNTLGTYDGTTLDGKYCFTKTTNKKPGEVDTCASRETILGWGFVTANDPFWKQLDDYIRNNP